MFVGNNCGNDGRSRYRTFKESFIIVLLRICDLICNWASVDSNMAISIWMMLCTYKNTDVVNTDDTSISGEVLIEYIFAQSKALTAG